MDIRPRLKAVGVQSMDGQVVLWQRALRRIYLDDSSGSVAAILQLLGVGEYRTAELAGIMAERGFIVTDEEVSAVLDALDDLGLLEQADGDDVLEPAVRERHESNL